MNFEDLYKILLKRKLTLPTGSYTAKLFKKGEDAILQKIGEEATEVILAGKGKKLKNLVAEFADLYFVMLVFLVYKDIPLELIYKELEERSKKKVKTTGRF